jgi:hypothetical protein
MWELKNSKFQDISLKLWQAVALPYDLVHPDKLDQNPSLYVCLVDIATFSTNWINPKHDKSNKESWLCSSNVEK